MKTPNPEASTPTPQSLGVPRPVRWTQLAEPASMALLLEIINDGNWFVRLSNLGGWKCELRWFINLEHPDELNEPLKLLHTVSEPSAQYKSAFEALRDAWEQMQEALTEFWENADREERLARGDLPALRAV